MAVANPEGVNITGEDLAELKIPDLETEKGAEGSKKKRKKKKKPGFNPASIGNYSINRKTEFV